MECTALSRLTKAQLDAYFELSVKQNDGMTKFWIDRGATIDGNERVLKYAIQNDNEKLVDSLLESNIDVNKYVEDEPIWFSALNSIEYLNQLSNYGMDINAKSRSGKTALEIAYDNNNFEVGNRLIELGINVNALTSSDITLLARIIASNSYNETGDDDKWFNRLLSAGADINKSLVNKFGTLILYYPAISGGNMLFKALNAGININYQDMDGKNILFGDWDYEYIVQFMGYGIDLNAQDREGRTVLMYQMRRTWPEKSIIELLLENGADPCIADNFGMTPLKAAKKSRNREILKLMKKYIKK